ncbi:MAG TPA: divergent PAP2 family protein [Candidatus Nanoarchaeia archaeon]|nr:divergent PAP2 family protein [Candidatus Nanoarchaeia archaeon]
MASGMMTLLTNPVFFSTAISALSVQFLKGIINALKTGNLSASAFIVSGGMPSGHSALVSALSASIFIHEGASTAFILSLFFGIVVIYDALILRMTVSRHSDILSQAISKLKIKTPKHTITGVNGHTPAQVIAGIILGIAIPLFLGYIL